MKIHNNPQHTDLYRVKWPGPLLRELANFQYQDVLDKHTGLSKYADKNGVYRYYALPDQRGPWQSKKEDIEDPHRVTTLNSRKKPCYEIKSGSYPLHSRIQDILDLHDKDNFFFGDITRFRFTMKTGKYNEQREPTIVLTLLLPNFFGVDQGQLVHVVPGSNLNEVESEFKMAEQADNQAATELIYPELDIYGCIAETFSVGWIENPDFGWIKNPDCNWYQIAHIPNRNALGYAQVIRREFTFMEWENDDLIRKVADMMLEYAYKKIKALKRRIPYRLIVSKLVLHELVEV